MGQKFLQGDNVPFSESVDGLQYDSATGVLSLTSGFVIPTTTQETNWNTAFTHVTSDGSDHSFLDQSVISGANVTFGTLGVGAITATGTITILSSTPILVFQDSDSLGAASVGFIEWRDSGGGRAGFLGNYTSSNDDLLWKNEQGGNIGIETTGAGEFQVRANLDVTGTIGSGAITATDDSTFGGNLTVNKDNLAQNGLILEGHLSGGPPAGKSGGYIEWHKDGVGTIAGYSFADSSFGNWTLDSTKESTGTPDAGVFNVSFSDGAVFAAGGDFDIDGSGNITDVGNITSDGLLTCSTILAGGGGFDVDGSGNITDVGNIISDGLAKAFTGDFRAGLTVNNNGGAGSSSDFRVESANESHLLFVDADLDVVKIGVGDGSNYTQFSATGDYTQAGTAKTTVTALFLNETTTPTPVADDGAIYTKSTNELFFQDGAGKEHLVHGDSFSVIWHHGISTVEVTISAIDTFTLIDSFTVVGNEDDLGNATGNISTNTITLSSGSGGEYKITYHGSVTATGGADKEMIFAYGITLATPKDITNVTDDLVTPIVITSTGHGLDNGDMVEIADVLGNTAANGSFIVDSKAADTFVIVALDGNATTGNGDYNEGSPTGEITIEYPGQMVVHRMVRGADLGALSATGIHELADSDVISLYVANVSGTTNLTVAAISFGIDRIGD